MIEDRDLLWGLYQEQRAQCRHHESQRAGLSSLIVAICAGILGIIAFDRSLNTADAWLATFMVVLGVYGALFSAKQYERYRTHAGRSEVYLADLQSERFNSALDTKKMDKEADARSGRRHPLLFQLRPIRLHWFWIVLNVVIAVFGVLLTLRCLGVI